MRKKNTPEPMTYQTLANWAQEQPPDEPVTVDLLAREGAISVRYTTASLSLLTRVLTERQQLVLIQTDREHMDPWIEDIFGALNRSASPELCRDLADLFEHIAENLEAEND